jgi:hypothetical protein
MSSSSHNDSAIAVHIPPNKEHSLYDSSIEVMPQAGVLSFFPRRVVSLDKARQSTHMLTPPVFKHITSFRLTVCTSLIELYRFSSIQVVSVH